MCWGKGEEGQARQRQDMELGKKGSDSLCGELWGRGYSPRHIASLSREPPSDHSIKIISGYSAKFEDLPF